jgi:hypothetical protein
VFVGMILQVLQTSLQFKDRLFKIERLQLHVSKLKRLSVVELKRQVIVGLAALIL